MLFLEGPKPCSLIHKETEQGLSATVISCNIICSANVGVIMADFKFRKYFLGGEKKVELFFCAELCFLPFIWC